ncbi:KOW domain-containing RNA-binding protein [Desmospora profundinema]|uniref:Ribosomal protein L14E/L6E/L27E n=1 Tax=Desmospora profundinema TaxID=1571184 RepID=A0ABU1ISM7_9BACL|nr:KOW domain-containing RNA-binding protein [Desmospora profundinema]MDR6226934.1 ribosomal protein L14E/L6E/L27E [Desmospora profundinema]
MDVTDAERRPSIGQIVQVKKGREAGRYAIVIGWEEPHFVLLVDGDKRKFGQSKKKNVKHIQPTKHIAREVAESMSKDGRVSNAKLRHALNQYLLQIGERKGE